jgi:DNA polymerase III epsilon subunit-like protein
MMSEKVVGENYATLDVETTGLSKSDEIIELTLVHANGDVLFNSLIRPTCAINWAAFNVHKISSGDLVNEPLWSDVEESFRKAVAAVDSIYIYNKSFDIRMIAQTYKVYNLVMPDFNSICAMQKVKLWLTERNMLSDGKVSLDRVCKLLSIPTDDVPRHRALGDCILTNRVLHRILNDPDQLPDSKRQLVKKSPGVQMSPEADAVNIFKHMIDSTLARKIDFKDWVELLNLNGVVLEPAFITNSLSNFSACYYSMGNLRVAASSLGSNYTPKVVMARGLIYDKYRDGALLESLFVAGQIKAQKTYFQKMLNNNEVSAGDLMLGNKLAKSTYRVMHTAFVGNSIINANFESHPDVKNKYSQLSFEALEPKGILLRNLEIQGIVRMEFFYDDKYSGVPVSVKLIMESGLEIIDGQGCVNKAVLLIKDLLDINISYYFKGMSDSDLFILKQVFSDASSGEYLGQVSRYLDSYSYEKCMIVPKIGPLSSCDMSAFSMEMEGLNANCADINL